ncbi:MULTISPECIES: hypothetical protein [Bradyrhizobium]|uniref:hypothetical protein n=1 Tax=Bradyrhizobium TaxID=374 RepID=UPI0007C4CFB5|nr:MULTISPECIES: hypothetical protein [Bradyrhizobium]PAY08669.1 DUF1611 domain-containing protein [Bradyrhizobium sp. UFLA03-84]
MTATQLMRMVRIPYSLRHVPCDSLYGLVDVPRSPEPGDVVVASVENVAKNSTLELNNGRRASLHEGDVIAAVFGNRYATLQFEGLVGRNEDACDLLSMGGLCGIVQSKHSKVAEPTRLRLLGAVADKHGRPLKMRDHHLKAATAQRWPHIAVVCGSSMNAGKTYTAMSIIKGLSKAGRNVAGIKLTGTATGKDTWSMLDAGASVALDFVDGGYPSTYMCGHDELLQLHHLLVGYAAAQSAEYVVVEIADGLLQRETAMLLQSPSFTSTVDSWIFAGGDPMAAESGVRMMRGWGVEPIAVSGALTMSSLNIREVDAATGVSCLRAKEIKDGALNALLDRKSTRNAASPLRMPA